MTTTTGPGDINVDLLNAFRFLNHGVDITQAPQQGMAEDLYDALAFMQANPGIEHFYLSPEWKIATGEAIAEIIGSNHFTFEGYHYV